MALRIALIVVTFITALFPGRALALDQAQFIKACKGYGEGNDPAKKQTMMAIAYRANDWKGTEKKTVDEYCQSLAEKVGTLTRLNLERSSITDLTPLILLPHLEILDLACVPDHANSIDDLTPLKDLPRLKALSLDGCIQIEKYDTLGGLKQLSELRISGHQITDLTKIPALPALKKLYATLSPMMTSLAGVERFSSLEELYLNRSRLKDLSAIDKLATLKVLSLAACSGIKNWEALKSLKTLTKLDLSGNDLSELTMIQELTSLEWLDIKNNFAKDLSTLRKLTQLKYLDASTNFIDGQTALNLSPLSEMKQLERLLLNQSGAVNLSTLPELPSLKELQLNGSPVGADLSILASLTNLKFLFADRSLRKNSDLTVLQKMTSLEGLSLANDQITHFPDVSGLKRLRFVNLSGNHLDNKEEIKEKLKFVKTLQLE